MRSALHKLTDLLRIFAVAGAGGAYIALKDIGYEPRISTACAILTALALSLTALAIDLLNGDSDA